MRGRWVHDVVQVSLDMHPLTSILDPGFGDGYKTNPMPQLDCGNSSVVSILGVQLYPNLT